MCIKSFTINKREIYIPCIQVREAKAKLDLWSKNLEIALLEADKAKREYNELINEHQKSRFKLLDEF